MLRTDPALIAKLIYLRYPDNRVKALIDEESGQILGCTVLGLEGGEVMTMVQVAMMGRLPYAALRDGTFSHPGLGECLNTLFLSLDS